VGANWIPRTQAAGRRSFVTGNVLVGCCRLAPLYRWTAPLPPPLFKEEGFGGGGFYAQAGCLTMIWRTSSISSLVKRGPNLETTFEAAKLANLPASK
jgi:hypothetical protein